MQLVEGYIGAGCLTGAAHTASGLPGQDYAITGVTRKAMWGVVCDGCSGGGTDVGLGAGALARVVNDFLARDEALHLLSEAPTQATDLLLGGLKAWEPLLGRQNLLATAVMAKIEGQKLVVRMIGDGGFALFHTDGSLSWYWASYTDNTPGYLAYHLQKDAVPADFDDNKRSFYVNEYRVLPGDDPELKRIYQPEPLWAFDTVAEDICGFALFTDGMGTLPRRKGIDVLMELVQAYGQRIPLNEALGNLAIDWTDKGEYPADDLAIILAHWD